MPDLGCSDARDAKVIVVRAIDGILQVQARGDARARRTRRPETGARPT